MSSSEATGIAVLVVLAVLCAIALWWIEAGRRRPTPIRPSPQPDHRPAPRPAATPPSTPAHDRPRWLLGGGGVAVAISPFLTWASVTLLGDFSLFDLFAAAGAGPGWALLLVALGGFAAYSATGGPSASLVHTRGLALGITTGVVVAFLLVSLANDIEDSQGFARLGIGSYLAIAGAASIFLAGLTPQRP